MTHKVWPSVPFHSRFHYNQPMEAIYKYTHTIYGHYGRTDLVIGLVSNFSAIWSTGIVKWSSTNWPLEMEKTIPTASSTSASGLLGSNIDRAFLNWPTDTSL